MQGISRVLRLPWLPLSGEANAATLLSTTISIMSEAADDDVCYHVRIRSCRRRPTKGITSFIVIRLSLLLF